MIYLKRLWNCIAFILSVAVFITMLPLTFIEVSIIAIVYYVVTGRDYIGNHFPVCVACANLVYKVLKIKNL